MTVTFNAPRLQTQRLILRAPNLSDFEAYAAFYATDRARFVGGPLDRGDTWQMLAADAGHWALRGYGRWTVLERDSMTPVGQVGLLYTHNLPEPELAWNLFDGATGKGYATEAALAAREYAYGDLGLETLISLIDPANTASQMLAERLGATHTTDFAHPKFGTLHLWRHPSPQDLSAGGVEAYS